MSENQGAPDPLREALTALADEWTRGRVRDETDRALGSVIRALLDAHPAPEPVGVELTVEEMDLIAEAVETILNYPDHGDALAVAVERILAARQAPTDSTCQSDDPDCPTCRATRQAPTVALSMETVAEVLAAHQYRDVQGDYEVAPFRKHFGCSCGWKQGIGGMSGWRSWVAAHADHLAAAVVAADPRRTEAEVKAEALREAAETWGTGEWQEQWAGDNVSDDVSAVQSACGWLRAEADRIAAEGAR